MAKVFGRAFLVEPLGSRGTRRIKNAEGEVVEVRPTVDSLLTLRKRKRAKKNRVVIRFDRGTK